MKLGDVQRNYDRLAGSYDFWNTHVFDRLVGVERLRERSVDRLGALEGCSVLDIGCGTGLNLPHLVSRVGPTGRIVGLDYSSGMLEQARRRVLENGWGNVELVQGDAGVMDGVDGPFDAVVSTLALGIVDDLPAALARAVEVLRPGGRLAVLDFHSTRPKDAVQRLFNPIYHLALRLWGVDTKEDLDDARLRRRWEEGKRFLNEALVDVVEESYFHGTGFLLSGAKAAP